MKKILLIAITTTIFTSVFLSAPTSAEDVNCESHPTDEACVMPINAEEPDENYAKPQECLSSDETGCHTTSAPVRDYDYPKSHPDNSDQISNPEAPEPETSVQEAPNLWPFYLSIGALGAAALIFIILNLSNHKRSQS